jgi:hypothetical protein
MNYQDIFDTVSPRNFKKHSDETRAKISASNKGHSNHSDYQKQRLSETHTGKSLSVEHKVAVSAANKGQNRMSFEARSKVHKGKTVSSETRAKLAQHARAVMTPYGLYSSVRSVADAANVSSTCVRQWVKKYPKHYYYVA